MAMKTVVARRTDPDVARAQRVEHYGPGGVDRSWPSLNSTRR